MPFGPIDRVDNLGPEGPSLNAVSRMLKSLAHNSTCGLAVKLPANPSPTVRHAMGCGGRAVPKRLFVDLTSREN